MPSYWDSIIDTSSRRLEELRQKNGQQDLQRSLDALSQDFQVAWLVTMPDVRISAFSFDTDASSSSRP